MRSALRGSGIEVRGLLRSGAPVGLARRSRARLPRCLAGGAAPGAGLAAGSRAPRPRSEGVTHLVRSWYTRVTTSVVALAAWLLELLFPSRCVSCGHAWAALLRRLLRARRAGLGAALHTLRGAHRLAGRALPRVRRSAVGVRLGAGRDLLPRPGAGRSSAPGRRAVSARSRPSPPSSSPSACRGRRQTSSPISRPTATARFGAATIRQRGSPRELGRRWGIESRALLSRRRPIGRQTGLRGRNGGRTSGGVRLSAAGSGYRRTRGRRLHDRRNGGRGRDGVAGGRGARDSRGHPRPGRALTSIPTRSYDAGGAKCGFRSRDGMPSSLPMSARTPSRSSPGSTGCSPTRRRSRWSSSRRRSTAQFTAEATVFAKGQTLRGVESTSDLRASIDKMVETMERQIVGYREKRRLERRRRTEHHRV